MSGIVTNGLIGYWHSNLINGNNWISVAPQRAGVYNISLFGATQEQDGILFDGIDDYGILDLINSSDASGSYEMEIYFKSTFTNSSDMGLIGKTYTEYKSSGGLGFEIITFENSLCIGQNGQSIKVSTVGVNTPLPSNQYIKINYVFHDDNQSIKAYINDSLMLDVINPNKTISPTQHNFNIGAIADNIEGTSRGRFFNGRIKSIKLYNRELTSIERSQNSSVGINVGLGINFPPKVAISSVSKNKISDKLGHEYSEIKFYFDQDVSQWEVRVLGAGQGTGVLADNGGSALAGEEITAIIDWTELQQEGENRVNIYGRGLDGKWTPYQR